MKSKTYIIGNWKMNPLSSKEAKSIVDYIKKKLPKTKTEVVICPPIVFLEQVTRGNRSKKILFGAQDVFWEEQGSFTGFISPRQLKEFGVTYCIVGHSERREQGETNDMVNKKIHALLQEKIRPVVCVGEEDRDSNGAYLSFIEKELKIAFENISAKDAQKVIVAYEPIWAIGEEEPATVEEMHQISIFIKKIIAGIYGPKVAENIPVIYGGAVDSSNVSDIITEGHMRGVLVGRSSLDPQEFIKMVQNIS